MITRRRVATGILALTTAVSTLGLTGCNTPETHTPRNGPPVNFPILTGCHNYDKGDCTDPRPFGKKVGKKGGKSTGPAPKKSSKKQEHNGLRSDQDGCRATKTCGK